LVVHDTLTDKVALEFMDDYIKPLNIHSFLDYPIIYEGKLVGLVSNEKTETRREWTQEEISFSSAIANNVALALEIEKKNIAQNRLHSLGLIVDQSINEIYIFDAKSLYFTYMNNAAQKNIGYTFEEIKEISPVDIKPQYNKITFKNFLKPLIEDKKEFLVIETLHQRKDFTTYPVEIRLQKMYLDGRDQFVAMTQDITQRKAVLQHLEESEEKFRNISKNSLLGIFIYQEKYVYVNDAFVNMLGYSTSEIYNLKPSDIIEKSFQEHIKQVTQRRLRGEEFPESYSDIKVLTKSGKIKIMRVATQTIKYKGGYAGMGSLIDITDIKKAKQELKLLAQAIGQMDELVKITDKNGTITYVNEALVAHSGYRAIELIGNNISIFKSGKHDKKFYENLWGTIKTGKVFRSVITNKKKNGSLYYEETTITPIIDRKGDITNFVATSQDITQRIKMEEKMKKLATRDSLTGIYNRYKTNEEIDSEIRRMKRHPASFALLMLDIDHFKLVNDTYGHDVGDYVLKELCKVVLNNIRESDKFGRWGGEEFMLVLPQTNKEESIIIAKKLRQAIESHTFKDISKITISVGVTTFNTGDTKEKLLKRVDDALYKAKEDGRNRVQFY
ncbi:MAG: diguanylate cyclase, partial [Sulfurimonas sp.]|nr:diguanylate cyclase [Sulfurimonas sp.]